MHELRRKGVGMENNCRATDLTREGKWKKRARHITSLMHIRCLQLVAYDDVYVCVYVYIYVDPALITLKKCLLTEF